VTRFLLDTNIVSDPSKPLPSPALERWLGDQRGEDLFISAWTIAELRRGILLTPHGKRRDALENWYLGPHGPVQLFQGRILAFDEAAADRWAELMIEGQKLGRARSLPDTIIASIAIAQNCVVVTNNERDFWGVPCLNPMKVDENNS
jgi:toxin FitB